MITNEKYIELARRFGTPLFVYDGDMMAERYHDLFRFIPRKNLMIHYALKANYNPALLALLRDEGAGIDAVSPGEVVLALALGFQPEKIIYTANNMTDAEFARVMKTGVTVNIGSLSRLKKCAQSHPGSRICLRFNPDVCDGDNVMTMTGGDLTKFGILLDDADEAARIAASRSDRFPMTSAASSSERPRKTETASFSSTQLRRASTASGSSPVRLPSPTAEKYP